MLKKKGVHELLPRKIYGCQKKLFKDFF